MASRTLALGGYGSTRFWMSAFCVALLPSSIGHQDLAALLSHRAAFPQHSHRHLLASPFGTIEPATFSYGIRPIGTAIPRPPAIELVNFDPRAGGAPVWSLDRPVRMQRSAQFIYPRVNRERKGDRLPVTKPAAAPANRAPLPQLQPISAPPAGHPVQPPVTPAVQPAPALPPVAPHAQAPSLAPAAQHSAAIRAPVVVAAAVSPPIAPRSAESAGAAEIPADVPASGQLEGAPPLTTASLVSTDDEDRGGGAQIYFGAGMTDAPSGLEAWAPGAEPVLATPSFDGGVKLAALEESGADGVRESIADDVPNPKSPAQRLGLTGNTRAKAEKCLTEAVYFEARGEPLRGQRAVAQVVMNRVFSGYYPNNVCGVVFQNASHYLACQFTFACEHKDLSRIEEPDMWEQAKRIAKDELDGKIWLTDIGHATHYHATWVHPSWVHEMTKLYKLGVHTFYRPRAWGKGEYEPVWGTPPNTSKADAKAASTS
jgi:cell wall hydrolase